MQEHSLLAPGMDLDMDDPYEEAEAEAAAEAAGLGGPAAEDSSDEDDSEAESDYEEKSFALLRSGKHQVRYPDGTFRCPFCPGKKKRDYKLKDLLQHGRHRSLEQASPPRTSACRPPCFCPVCPHRPVLLSGACRHHWHSRCYRTC
jgi:hypothetical protein